MLWIILIGSTIPYLQSNYTGGKTEYFFAIGAIITVFCYYSLDSSAAGELLKQSYNKLKKSPHLILYFASMLLSILLLIFYYNDDVEIGQAARMFGYLLIGLVGYIIIPVIVYPKRFRQYNFILMIIGSFNAVLGLLSVFTGMSSFLGLRLLREEYSPLFGIQSIAGPFFEVNTYATVLALGIVGSFYFINRKDRIFISTVSFFLCSFALFFTWSRSMYFVVPLGIGLLVFSKLNPKKKFWFLLSGFLCIIGLVVAICTVPLLQRLMQLESGLSGRNILWDAALRANLSRPFAGYGFGREIVHDVMSNFGGIYRGIVKSSHNGFLEVGIQAGALTAASFFLVFVISFYRLLRSPIEALDKISIAYGLMVTFIITFFFAYLLGGVSYTSLNLGIFWGLGNFAYLHHVKT